MHGRLTETEAGHRVHRFVRLCHEAMLDTDINVRRREVEPGMVVW
jgi:hypothetical protein